MPGVPLIPAAIVLLVCVLLAVFVTRASMAGKVNEARAEAATAQAKVEELTRTLERERAAASSSSRSQSNGGTSVAGAAAELGQGEGVEDPWLSSGRFGTGDEALDEAVKEFCDARVSTSMGLDDAALEVYKAIAWSDYVERDNAQHPAGKNWRIQYALQYYENGNSGNCYEFASFLMYCLRYLGFEDAQAEGVLVQLQSGAWGDHGIVYVTNTDGTRCMCDTARGTDGWMLGENAYNVKIEDFESA